MGSQPLTSNNYNFKTNTINYEYFNVSSIVEFGSQNRIY